MKTLARSDASPDKLLPMMKAVPQWICWADHRNPSVDKKIPLDTSQYVKWRNEFRGRNWSDPSIWMSYEEALQIFYEHDCIDGIGFVVKNKQISFVDIDNCVSSDDKVDDEVYRIIRSLNSYAEISPSGNGVHVYCSGDFSKFGDAPDDSPVEISVFDSSWTTITFLHIEKTPFVVREAANQLKNICDKYDIRGEHRL